MGIGQREMADAVIGGGHAVSRNESGGGATR